MARRNAPSSRRCSPESGSVSRRSTTESGPSSSEQNCSVDMISASKSSTFFSTSRRLWKPWKLATHPPTWKSLRDSHSSHRSHSPDDGGGEGSTGDSEIRNRRTGREKCYPCARFNLLPMCPVAQRRSTTESGPSSSEPNCSVDMISASKSSTFFSASRRLWKPWKLATHPPTWKSLRDYHSFHRSHSPDDGGGEGSTGYSEIRNRRTGREKCYPCARFNLLPMCPVAQEGRSTQGTCT